jgi:hypothetical protein
MVFAVNQRCASKGNARLQALARDDAACKPKVVQQRKDMQERLEHRSRSRRQPGLQPGEKRR